jgi:hypothetical protein
MPFADTLIPEAVGDDACRRPGRGTEEHHELLAPVAARDVVLAERSVDELRNVAEDAVAVLVAVGVVDQLEVVDIDDDDGKWPLVALRVCGLLAESALEVTPIEQTGERIVRRVLEGETELVLELPLHP